MMKTRMSSPPEDGAIEQRIYLYPGGLWAERCPGTITTVLGSCVSVCLWDPRAGLGGINHFVLPHGGSAASGRYGNHSLAMLLERVLRLGTQQEDLVAGVFGGACVLTPNADVVKLGARNVAEAIKFLQRNSITIIRQDVGGQSARKLIFRPAAGTTTVVRL